MASPELFPAETFYQQTQCVKVVHRSCGRLTGANAAVMVGDLLDAATAGQQLGESGDYVARSRNHEHSSMNDIPFGTLRDMACPVSTNALCKITGGRSSTGVTSVHSHKHHTKRTAQAVVALLPWHPLYDRSRSLGRP